MLTQNAGSKDSLTRIFQWFTVIVFGGVILYVGKPLFIPLSYAVFISFILQPVCAWLERRGWKRDLAISASLVLMFIVSGILIWFIISQFRNFIRDWPEIKLQLISITAALEKMLVEKLHLQPDVVSNWFESLTESLPFNSVSGIGSTAMSIGVGMVMLLLIPVYVFLILHYRQLLVDALTLVFPESRRNQVKEVIRLSIGTYYGFIKGMIVVYLIVGVLNSVGLLLLGVPHAILFGFLTAVMTIIPYVGIMVASVMPIIYAWVTFQSIWYPIGVVAIFAFVQYLEANVIFPWAVSSRLQLNTLITLIVIILGGVLWGASGMILFIPMAAILKLIADRMEGWEGLSRILGK